MQWAGMGTPTFFAPEQHCKSVAWRVWRDNLMELEKALGWTSDHRPVDVWQLAVTWLLHLCPEGQGNALAKFMRKLSRPRLLPRRRLPKATPAWLKTALSPELRHLIFDCMLVPNLKRRWSVRQIMHEHPVFNGVDWDTEREQRVPLPVDLVGLAAAGRQRQQQTEEERAQAALEAESILEQMHEFLGVASASWQSM